MNLDRQDFIQRWLNWEARAEHVRRAVDAWNDYATDYNQRHFFRRELSTYFKPALVPLASADPIPEPVSSNPLDWNAFTGRLDSDGSALHPSPETLTIAYPHELTPGRNWVFECQI